MKTKELTKKEIGELIGGICHDCSTILCTTLAQDNTNTKTFCYCTYKNTPAVLNDNAAEACQCVCGTYDS